MSTRTKIKFEEFEIQGGRTLMAANVRDNTRNYDRTNDLLRDNGLELVRFQILIPGIAGNPDALRFSKGSWGYAAGVGLPANLEGLHNWDSKGELTGHTTSDPEKTVRVWSGPHPLSLVVNSDDYTRSNRRRFVLDANVVPSVAAPVVFGIRTGSEAAELQASASVQLARGVTQAEFSATVRAATNDLGELAKTVKSERLENLGKVLRGLDI